MAALDGDGPLEGLFLVPTAVGDGVVAVGVPPFLGDALFAPGETTAALLVLVVMVEGLPPSTGTLAPLMLLNTRPWVVVGGDFVGGVPVDPLVAGAALLPGGVGLDMEAVLDPEPLLTAGALAAGGDVLGAAAPVRRGKPPLVVTGGVLGMVGGGVGTGVALVVGAMVMVIVGAPAGDDRGDVAIATATAVTVTPRDDVVLGALAFAAVDAAVVVVLIVVLVAGLVVVDAPLDDVAAAADLAHDARVVALVLWAVVVVVAGIVRDRPDAAAADGPAEFNSGLPRPEALVLLGTDTGGVRVAPGFADGIAWAAA